MFTIRDAARLFSSKRIAEIASGDFSYLLKVATHYEAKLGNEFTAADVFELAYDGLAREYRSEYFFKNIVAERLLFGKHSLNTATVLPEFRVGRSKADCVVLNGSSTCYEIKSDFDNLDRLPEQLAFYKKIFDRIFVVVGKAHIEKVQELCAEDIGIIELTQRKNLRLIRDAKTSSEPVDVSIVMRSLRVDEYKALVYKVTGVQQEHPNTEIFSVCEEILQTVPSSEIRKAFCSVLKDSRKIEKEFILSLPRTLLMAGVGFRLSMSQRRNLIGNLKNNFSKDALCTTQFCVENSLN